MVDILEKLELKRKEIIEAINIYTDLKSSDIIKKSQELDKILNNYYQHNKHKR